MLKCQFRLIKWNFFIHSTTPYTYIRGLILELSGSFPIAYQYAAEESCTVLEETEEELQTNQHTLINHHIPVNHSLLLLSELQLNKANASDTEAAFLYPLFSLEKKGKLISCQSRSVVRPSVRAYVRPSRFL